MLRIVLERMLLFALPFGLFGAYVWLFHRRLDWPKPDTPWFWLTVSGFVLVIASFFYAGISEGESTKGLYVAPQYVDGKIIQGHVDESKQQ